MPMPRVMASAPFVPRMFTSAPPPEVAVAGLKAASGRSGLQMRDDGVAGLVHDSRVVQLPGHFHLAAEASGGFFQGAGHGVALGEHAILVQRAALPHERHDGGHDVHGTPPSMRPTLAVVHSSMRPSGMATTAAAAI